MPKSKPNIKHGPNYSDRSTLITLCYFIKLQFLNTVVVKVQVVKKEILDSWLSFVLNSLVNVMLSFTPLLFFDREEIIIESLAKQNCPI